MRVLFDMENENGILDDKMQINEFFCEDQQLSVFQVVFY